MRRWPLWAGTTVAVGYCVLVADTRPFTIPADAATAAGFVPASLFLLRLRWHRRERVRRPIVSFVPWTAAIGFLALLELGTYLAGIHVRNAVPTISSLYDDIARWRALKALAVGGWLALGYGLFRP